MENLITRTAKLQPRIKRVKSVPSYATCYTFEAESDAPELGNLYVVLETLVAPKQGAALGDLIIETVGDHYYNQEVRGELDILSRFEGAVKATNKALKDYAENGNAGWVGRLSAILAVVAEDQIHLTQAGSAEGYLYRGNVVSHITDGLQASGPHRAINSFSNIASGKLAAHDRLLLSTPALLHQTSGDELKNLINDNSPNGAVAKLSQLLGQKDDADRIAALVIEVTTPTVLAASARPDEPDEALVGQPDKPLEIAKAVAGPAVDTLVSRSKTLGAKAAESAKTKVLPQARSAGLSAAAWTRKKLSTKTGRQVAGALLVAIIIVSGWMILVSGRQQSVDKQVKQYDQLFAAFSSAEQLKQDGNSTGARSGLTKVSQDLSTLAKSKNLKALDQALLHHSHPENDPANVEGLLAKASSELDQIDGITAVTASQLADLSSLRQLKPSLVRTIGTKLVLIDAGSGAVAEYDTQTKNLTATNTTTAGLGHVIDATPTSSGDGLYLLTSEPAVWFYSLKDKSLAKQAVGLEGWPKSTSIASYGGNLYLLASDGSQVYKHLKTAGGFGGKTGYFTADTTADFNGATAMAVDGAIYLARGNSIKRYLQGNRDAQSINLPVGISHPISLQSVASGDTIISFDSSTHHVGVLTATATTLSFSKQAVVSNATPSSVTADDTGRTLYLISGTKLMSAVLP